MSGMFSGCPSLASLDISAWDTSSLASSAGMCAGAPSALCSNLGDTDMVLEVTVSSGASVTIDGVEDAGACNATVAWGDGAASAVVSYDSANLTHTYSSGGVYNITINGTFPGFTFSTSPEKLTNVCRLGETGLTTLRGASQGCYNLRAVGGDATTGAVTDISYMFSRCSNLTALDASSWDTSNAETMEYAFSLCSSLTALDVASWGTSGAADMSSMFYSCSALTPPLGTSGWDNAALEENADMCADTPAGLCDTISLPE
eukprot:gnl/Chilomastix_cuspidata/249.p4 GENE.gnl/Chilomastix_cuspidata/249~~gnl/Chilomastix_cuspidata/249.p4  ORF type:complete len:260 (-),score=83.03 gnl/Chilomastix_cuspidata/249:4813-5592(-)